MMPQSVEVLSSDLVVSMADLWLPILIAAVVVFILSCIAWTVAPHHKGEHRKLPAEPGFLDALRSLNIPAGGYFFPYCDGAAMKTEEGQRVMKAGPWGHMRIYEKMPGMGGSMLASFLLYLAVSAAIAFVGTMTLPVGASFGDALRLLGTVGVLSYSVAVIPQIIWFERQWSVFFTHLFDGVVLGLATGLVFAWMWPSLTVAAA